MSSGTLSLFQLQMSSQSPLSLREALEAALEEDAETAAEAIGEARGSARFFPFLRCHRREVWPSRSVS